MKKKIFFIAIGFAIALTACKEEEPAPIASVEIEDATIETSYREANISWRLTSNATVNEVVVEYAEDSAFVKFEQAKMSLVNPKADDALYSAELKPLKEGTQYFLRCRVLNKVNSYATESQAFKTKAYQIAKVRTDSISDITVSSAKLCATLIENGTDSIPEVGFCVATHENVTIADSCLVYPLKSNKDSIAYSVSLKELKDNTTYYIRAYAKNSKGVAYGEELLFFTPAIGLPEIGDIIISEISYTSATIAGEILSDGKSSITERGICYSTSPNPTIMDNKLSEGSDIGQFTCHLVNLVAGTVYYVRAYAVNGKGISYGKVESFSTTAYLLPTIVTSVATNITYTTATCGGQITSAGDASNIERGVCYSTSPCPTIYNTKIVNGSGIGSYQCNLVNLTPGMTYYVRAYADSDLGIVYGNEVSFVTKTSTKIIYTASEKLIETTNSNSAGLHTNAFGEANIIYHEFINGEGTIMFGDELLEIGERAFYRSSGLMTITIPNSVTYIGKSAFSSCSGLTSIILPDSVTSIGEEAFSTCTSLTSVNIPSSITSIGKRTFYNCHSLTSVEIPNGVTKIEDYTFYNCDRLSSITIPNSVTSIGESAFSDCKSLTSIAIPNSVTDIGFSAFAYTGISTITIPYSVISIGSGAFRGCGALSSIVVDSNNSKYDSRSNCNGIIETATNTYIQGCKNSFIPTTVTILNAGAFMDCKGLITIAIPNGVTSIGSSTFAQCADLQSVIISSTVTNIGYSAFDNCSNISTIRCDATIPPQCVNNMGTFRNVNKSIPLYVPANSISAYQQADEWKDFTNILPISE